MKKIDAHAHIGDFGSWAGVDGSPEQLIAFMDEYEIEQTVLCAKDHTGNEGVAEAAARAALSRSCTSIRSRARTSAAKKSRPMSTERASAASR